MKKIEGLWGPAWRSNLHELVNVALLFAGLVVLARGVWVFFHGEVAGGVAGLGAGLVLLLAATVDRFESLKGLGLEAKTREVTERIEKADQLFAKLQDLAAHVYAGIVKQAAGSRYWKTAYNEAELNHLAEQTRTRLKALDVSEDQIQLALGPWADEVLWRWVCKAARPWFDSLEGRYKQLSEELSALHPDSSEDARNQREALQLAIREIQDFRTNDGTNKLFRHPRSDLIAELSRAMDRTPTGIDRTCHSQVRQLADEWREELDYLQSHRELKTAKRWDEFIGWKKEPSEAD